MTMKRRTFLKHGTALGAIAGAGFPSGSRPGEV